MSPTADPLGEPDDRLVADVFARTCTLRQTLENIASKWGILALAALRDGSYRFNALRRRVDGVSEKMLAQTLHALERDGLINRDVHTAIPPRVEYSLTPLGERVTNIVLELIGLLKHEIPAVHAARQRYDEAKQHREYGNKNQALRPPAAEARSLWPRVPAFALACPEHGNVVAADPCHPTPQPLRDDQRVRGSRQSDHTR